MFYGIKRVFDMLTTNFNLIYALTHLYILTHNPIALYVVGKRSKEEKGGG